MAERLLGEVETRRGVDARLAIELLEEKPIVRRVYDHRHGGEILGRGANHRGPAYVDVLHGVREGGALGDLVLEGI